MIWIATLCLLAVIAWLFFNALNERRWVEAHSHDESVAADKGFLPDLSSLTAKMTPATDGKVSLEHENTAFARAVGTVREKSAKVGEKIERRVAEARERNGGETFFDRAVDRIGGAATRIDRKIDERARAKAAGERRPITEEDSFFGRTTARVAQKQEEYGARIRERVARKAGTDQPARPIGEEDSFFGRSVAKVSGKLGEVGRKLDDKAARARDEKSPPRPATGPAGDDDDLMMRASRKIGGRINEIDDKIVDTSKSTAAKIDRKTDL